MRKQFLITLAALIICLSVTAQSWYPIDSNTDKELKTIQFISDEIGFIGGDSILMKTVDGGITWNEIVSDLSDFEWIESLDVYDLHFFDENHGYIMSGLYGAMLETFDGGLTWEEVLVSAGFCQQASLYFENEDYGFAGGAGCFEGHIIGKYENGTWTQTEDPQDWSGADYVTTINFKDSDLGFAGTIEGTLLRTTNGGDLWDTIPNPAAGFAITDIDFDGDVIRASHTNSSEHGSMVSMDDGLTWEFDNELIAFFNREFNALHTSVSGVAYAGGNLSNTEGLNGLIFERDELPWLATTLEFKINDMESHSENSVFAVGANGAIYTNQADIANGVKELESVELNVFPNPVASGDFLTVELPNWNSYTLKLEDMTGACILSKSIRETSSVNGITLEGLSAGVYVLSVRSAADHGNFRSVRVIVQ